MKIKSIKLNNIRSYVNEEINFSSGTVLLSGDIGAGKSSILQAIEFALFGILRGELSGASLLRKGTNSGYVELSLLIDKKDVVIKRMLKRDKSGVSQDSGILIIDGKKEELTANELKAKIFNILGYPEELVTKSKFLLYRYTVYTPQEEMKRILFEDKDDRLDTLRRLFEIDKYRRITENSEIVLRKLREMKRSYSLMILDLNDKLKQKASLEKELSEVKNKISNILPELNAIKEFVLKKKKELADVENRIKKLNDLKKMDAVLKERISLAQAEYNEKRMEFDALNKEVLQLESKLKEVAVPEVRPDKEKIENEINKIEIRLSELNSRKGELEYIKRLSLETKKSMISLKICPVCQQDVSEDHKHKIITKENTKISDADKQLAELEKEKADLQTKIDFAKKELKNASEYEKAIEKKEQLIKEEKEKKTRSIVLLKKLKELENELTKNKNELIAMGKELDVLKGADRKLMNVKNEFDDLLSKEKNVELKKIGYEKECEGIEKQLIVVNAEIEKRQIYRKKIELIEKTTDWIENHFVPIVKLIEKHIMYRIYVEFNELFQQWASTLLGDENLSIKLDEEFTPLIEQNGYETELSDLSGGEKTACALAYRLALNRVINDVISGIKTKGIIILDEPTDGFSSEQLDKVRDVLEQLRTNQTILVSHEAKLESFVEHIIRISKTGHVSKVIS